MPTVASRHSLSTAAAADVGVGAVDAAPAADRERRQPLSLTRRALNQQRWEQDSAKPFSALLAEVLALRTAKMPTNPRPRNTLMHALLHNARTGEQLYKALRLWRAWLHHPSKDSTGEVHAAKLSPAECDLVITSCCRVGEPYEALRLINDERLRVWPSPKSLGLVVRAFSEVVSDEEKRKAAIRQVARVATKRSVAPAAELMQPLLSQMLQLESPAEVLTFLNRYATQPLPGKSWGALMEGLMARKVDPAEVAKARDAVPLARETVPLDGWVAKILVALYTGQNPDAVAKFLQLGPANGIEALLKAPALYHNEELDALVRSALAKTRYADVAKATPRSEPPAEPKVVNIGSDDATTDADAAVTSRDADEDDDHFIDDDDDDLNIVAAAQPQTSKKQAKKSAEVEVDDDDDGAYKKKKSDKDKGPKKPRRTEAEIAAEQAEREAKTTDKKATATKKGRK